MLLAMLAAWVIATVAFTRTLEQRVESQIGNAANVITRNGLPLTPFRTDDWPGLDLT